MNEPMHDCRYPGESGEYREARDELLRAETELIAHIERVAAMRRTLPPGGLLKEDYVFEEGPADLRDTRTVQEVKLSELFGEHSTLILINTMWAPDDTRPCPSCNSLADTYNATAPHLSARVGLALVTRAPLQKLRAWAAARHWRDIRLLSSFNNSFNEDYRTQEADDRQIPSITIFSRGQTGEIRHHYSIEGHFLPPLEGQDPRHLDLYWPLWQLLDLTPEGRGTDWYPTYSYDKRCL
jgi:predicted dithiol-disulfide oxidoreductase (DUF899 family)